MKRILLFCIFSMTLFSVTGWTLDARRLKKDSQGHVLVKLWDSYRKADDEDRPQEKSEILLKIKETAGSAASPSISFWRRFFTRKPPSSTMNRML